MTIALLKERAALREHVAAWRASGKRIGLVPTMGALHAGHMRLVEAAREVTDRIVVTIFVNPTQFAPSEDFTTYPRDLEADCLCVAAAGGDLVYAPALSTMYPNGFATGISVGGPAKAGLEDRFRPTHFDGVATIVAKLLFQVAPDIAFFGEKDFQQLRVIERLVVDLDIPVAIAGVPVMREADGLALSSRNVYLDANERERAPALYWALVKAAAMIGEGGPIGPRIDEARRAVAAAGFLIDYIEARRSDDLTQFVPGETGRIIAAARLGRTRLIDNVAII